MSPLLGVRSLDAHHGQLQAVRSFNLELEAGDVTAVIGANGAGKSTLLRTLAGAHPSSRGTITLEGNDITALPAHRRVALGICMVPEGRRLFASLSVKENLQAGMYRARPGPWDLAAIHELFPWMAERAGQNASSLSGGQQQAVAIGRALVANPRVLLIDELSLGLAPAVVKQMYAVLPRITAEGTAVLIVEQDVSQALASSGYVHCLLEGRTMLSGAPEELTNTQVQAAYFGMAEHREGH